MSFQHACTTPGVLLQHMPGCFCVLFQHTTFYSVRTLSGIDPLPLHISKAHAVEIYGISYRIGVVVRLPPKANEPPVFGHITAIYVLSDIKYFVVEVFYIHVFVLHFFSYTVCHLLRMSMLYVTLIL